MRDLLLLHGAIGSQAQFAPLIDALQNRYRIHTLNFSGHGGTAITGDFSIARFADEVRAYLDANRIDAIDIFGYSMGGYVALHLAKTHPERIGRVFTLATKFEWTPETAAREIRMLNADKIVEKIPAFAAELEKRHAPQDWKAVLARTVAMMIGLGDRNPLTVDDLERIPHTVRLAVGDKDQMVSLEETAAVYRRLPHASLCVFPDTPHPIEKVDAERLARELEEFFVNRAE